MNWYIEALKKYAVFDGRARRKECWYFALFNIVISVVLTIIDIVIGTYSTKENIGLLGGIYTLAVLIPSIAVSVRRLHDTNRSGWWMIIGLIPLIGGIILVIFMVQDSQQGENQYGPNPKVPDDTSSVARSTIKPQRTRPAPVVELEGRVSIDPPVGQQQTAVDEESIYTMIAKELETGVADKGLWTRLFAECGGDEKQTKVLYIKQRAERLISAEKMRLEQEAKERAEEVARLEQIRWKKQLSDRLQALSESPAALWMLDNVAENNLREVRNLVSNEPLLVAVKNSEGDTPLHIAVREKNHAMVSFLLKNGARVDVKNMFGVTPIDYAKTRDWKTMVSLMTAHP